MCVCTCVSVHGGQKSVVKCVAQSSLSILFFEAGSLSLNTELAARLACLTSELEGSALYRTSAGDRHLLPLCTTLGRY